MFQPKTCKNINSQLISNEFQLTLKQKKFEEFSKKFTLEHQESVKNFASKHAPFRKSENIKRWDSNVS